MKTWSLFLVVVVLLGALAAPAGAVNGVIASGQTVAGNLAAAGQLDSYAFSSDAGVHVTVLMGRGSVGFTPYLELQAPDGTVVKSTYGGSAAKLDSVALPQTGTYYLVCQDYTGNYTGTYALTLIENPGPTSPPDVDGGPITSGETKPGNISLGDLDAFTFSASVGDHVTVMMGRGSVGFTPYIELQAPDGTVVASTYGGSAAKLDSIALPQTGVYYVICQDYTGNYTGSYNLSLTIMLKDPPPPPAASFSALPTTGQAPLEVQFTDTSTGSPTAWLWDFGDGATSSEEDPSHTYLVADSYDVALTVWNASGADTKIQTGYIVLTPPTADFTTDKTSGVAPLAVQFTDTSTGAPISWMWGFGDGAASTTQDPSHTYQFPGIFTVSLSASNAVGSDTVTKANLIQVNAAPIAPPVADLSASKTSGVAPLTVQFTDTSTPAASAWQWVFGDATTSLQESPSHTYQVPGVFTVSLTASNAGGSSTKTKANLIQVDAAPVPPPVADFTADKTSGPAPLAVQFTDASTGTPVAWGWTFGDGATSAEQDPGHTYPAPGLFTVSLTASNAGGSNTRAKPGFIEVDVTPTTPPTADFTADQTAGVAPFAVQFTDASTGEPTGWLWSFGDASGSLVQSPDHTYTSPGLYTVSLAASNAGGATTKSRPEYIIVTFPDLPVNSWAVQQTLACVKAGIVSGYPDGTYAPTGQVTRDQMAVYIARALAGGDAGVPAGPAAASFPDVTTGYWAFKYVEYAKAQGVVSGYPDGTYQPTNPVDRGQMSVYIARAAANPVGEGGLADYIPPTTPSFSDVDTGFWAYKYVEYCKSKSIVGGYPDGTYQPAGIVTRDQMAVYVARAFGLG